MDNWAAKLAPASAKQVAGAVPVKGADAKHAPERREKRASTEDVASSAAPATTAAPAATAVADTDAAAAFNAPEIDAYLRSTYTRLAADAVTFTPLESTSQWKTKVDRRASIKEKNGARNVIRHDRLQVDILFELNRLVYQQQQQQRRK